MIKEKAKKFWKSYQYVFYALALVFVYRLVFCYTILRIPFSQDNVMGKYHTSNIPNPFKMHSLEQRLAIYFKEQDTITNAGNHRLEIRKGYFKVLDAYKEDGKVLAFVLVEPVVDEPFDIVLFVCSEDLKNVETHF